MKTTVWTLATCTPENGTCRPALVETFATEAAARAKFDEYMRNEWAAHEPCDEETDEPLPYPGDPEEAHEILRADREDSDGELWGEYELSSHEIDIPEPASAIREAVAAARELYRSEPCAANLPLYDRLGFRG